jgi:hypothetical protein
MGRRLKNAEKMARLEWCEALVDAIDRHPEGMTTERLADALGLDKCLTSTLLVRLGKAKKVGRKFIYGHTEAGNHTRISLWLPAALAEVAPNSITINRKESGFVPYPDFEESHQEFVRRASEPKQKFNPWTRAA